MWVGAPNGVPALAVKVNAERASRQRSATGIEPDHGAPGRKTSRCGVYGGPRNGTCQVFAGCVAAGTIARPPRAVFRAPCTDHAPRHPESHA